MNSKANDANTDAIAAPISDAELEAYAKGERELKDLVGMAPEYLAALKGRAQFFIDDGSHERALMMLDMLEELDRTEPMPSLLAAEILLKDGKSDAARQRVDAVLSRHPELPDGLVALAEVHIATGAMVRAAELLAKVIDADPDGSNDATKRAFAVAARAHAMMASA
ncbi:MAG: hypothetical protein A2289_09110 [Deltaproteobacteria bacterium RIFOXYA12_FULL_58_15]|nr:MAG: hypothetical protein A2289_09110 [Deltaproteobacteria bacterium RIFOXYA12_FULL_58_15]OGR09651.1 MAG: hypothetical protein A2341_14750 [Deltaproteobacteria bacterium RIFOXYB12_FULL_58_9]